MEFFYKYFDNIPEIIPVPIERQAKNRREQGAKYEQRSHQDYSMFA